MSICLANYRGISWVSRCIELATYSVYSHSAALFTEDMEVDVDGKIHLITAGSVIEAWEGGVTLQASISDNHKEKTQVDIFDFKTPLDDEQEQRMARFLIRSIGRKYAYLNVARFIPLVRILFPKPLPYSYTKRHMFCSELVLLASQHAGVPLLERCEAWEVPPRDLSRSPLLYFKSTEYTA